jgi:hypothetical protein
MLKNKVILSLTKVTAVSFFNELNLCGGDSQGKVEIVSLRQLSHMKVESLVLEYHRSAIELTRMCKKDVIRAGYWIVTYANGCFALWDSTAHITPLNVVYCNLPDFSYIVEFNNSRNK